MKLRYLLGMTFAVGLIGGCSTDYMDFKGGNFVQFSSSAEEVYTFAYFSSEKQKDTLNIGIMSIGEVVDYPRTIRFEQVTKEWEYTYDAEDPNKVVDSVYEKIEDAEIWIPYGEVFKHYKSKRSDINKRVRKSLNEKEESQIEKVCFMNMCMIQDHKGNVLALDKVNDSYTGTTFPGGHVEANEIFQKSMIREVWEETGLTVEAPKLGGLYHWHKSGVHYVITLYKADKFTGELKSSEEGRVYWIPLEELKTKELATGMEHVLRILESEKVDECYMHLEADGYVGDLY